MTLLRRAFLPSTADLLAFEAAARHQSVSRAAEELHLTQSAVSRQIRQLEDQIGTALFHRVRQRVVLTDAGRVYAADVQNVLQQLSASTQKAMAFSSTDGLLNLAVLPTLGTRWLIPRLGGFMALHPEAMVNFSARTEPFDFAGTPFDAAIHFGTPHWAGAVCEYLMHEETVPVCSPTQWAEWFELVGVPTALALRGPQSEHFAMIAQAAVSHLGAALLPRFLIEQELAAGSLVELSDQVLTSTDAYYLVYPEARAQTPLVKAFRDWVVGECAGQRQE
jgi:LysR family glycine cleavage system transcriptional activator